MPGVPRLLVDGRPRRSYVLWQELVPPLLVLEFVSGDGSEERDQTPDEGKFWIYENRIRPAYYGIYEVNPGRIEMYRLVEDRFEVMSANTAGRFPIRRLGVELGIWQGEYLGMDLPWRDDQGNMLLMGHELAAEERQRAERESKVIERMAAKLRELGVDPNSL